MLESTPSASDWSRLTILVQRLADARRAAGLTQQYVADKLGRPQSFVAKYEQGERRLDILELIVVCQLIGARHPRLN